MKKEIFVVITILILIIIINIICQNYLSKAVYSTNKQIEELSILSKKCLEDDDEKENIKKQLENTNDEWNIYRTNLSLYVEHDELEKVDTEFALFNTYIDLKNYEDAIPEMKECIFILDHIKKKNKMSISNLL